MKKCLECEKLIHNKSVRCAKCNGKLHSQRMLGQNNPAWKGDNKKKNFCINCGKQIHLQALRCQSCNAKYNNPMTGKSHKTSTKKLIRQKSLEQFKDGMPTETKQKLKLSRRPRSIASNGHTFITTSGYVWLKIGPHDYMGEHRFVVEKYLGRCLFDYELVHHIDGNKTHNDLSNLYVFDKKEVHFSLEILIKNNFLPQNCLRSNLKLLKETGIYNEGLK